MLLGTDILTTKWVPTPVSILNSAAKFRSCIGILVVCRGLRMQGRICGYVLYKHSSDVIARPASAVQKLVLADSYFLRCF
jgi:hypothetical protein